MSELLRYNSMYSIDKIPQCGLKTYMELKHALAMYDEQASLGGLFSVEYEEDSTPGNTVPTEISAFAQDIYESLLQDEVDDVAEYFCNCFPDAERFLLRATDDKAYDIPYDDTANIMTIISVWDLSVRMLQQIAEALNINEDGSIEYIAFRNRLKHSISKINMLYYNARLILPLTHATPTTLMLLDYEYEKILSTLSVRSRNVLIEAKVNGVEAIKLSRMQIPELMRKFSNCGRKSAMEIRERLGGLYDRLLKISALGETEVEKLQATIKFPFLSEPQAENAAKYRIVHGRYPLYNIVTCYYTGQVPKYDAIVARVLGVSSSPTEMSEVAEMYGVSRERIRQIVVQYDAWKSIPGAQYLSTEEYKFADNLYMNPAKYADSIRDSEFDCDNNFTIENFCAITRLFLAHKTSYYHLQDMDLFVRNDVAKRYDLERAVYDMQYSASLRRTDDIILVPTEYIGRYLNRDEAPHPHAAEVLISITTEILGHSIDEHGNLILSANAIDLEREIYRIIEQSGKALHISEIINRLEQKFPRHTYKKSTVRSYILSSDRITCIGNTSTYALKKWNLNNDTIRVLLRKTISESDVPLSLEEIAQILREQGRNISIASISSNIYLDDEFGFERYKGGLIGIAGRKYDDYPEPLQLRSTTRRSIDDRLQQYIDFIDTYHHVPYCTGETDEECTLYRWYKNVTNEHIESTPEQRERLQQELAKRTEYIMPLHEYRFISKCRQYREYVETHGALPDAKTEPSMHKWYQKAHREHLMLSDRCRTHFTDLVDYLANTILN